MVGFLGVVLLSNVFVGCSNNKISQDSMGETNYYSVSIDGDKFYYSAEDENVVEISKNASEFITVAVKKDYTNPEVMKEYDYYTKEVKEAYLSDGRPEIALESLQNYQLKVEVNEVTLQKIEFYTLNGQKTASVTIDYISTITNSTPEYLESLAIQANTKYKRTMTIVMVHEEELWKVSTYSLTAREEVQ